ncbi:DUF92 domain-containing protein [Olivibacter sp. CPCC 100613]|uniref:DUF92 domain-containing protein n=1 Tax=Olivibacter sp. CPCC 100613 TaxID=3079931 RepID=UPI002FF513AC
MGNSFLFFCFSLLICAILAVLAKRLTVIAAGVAYGIGLLVFFAMGGRELLMLCLFFILGVLATSHKKAYKTQLFALPKHEEIRTVGQVLANGGVTGLLAICCLIDSYHADLYKIMMVGSLASALADTLSSELGIVYGRSFYNILTLKEDLGGRDGVVSIEGTLIGIVASALMAFAYAGIDKTTIFIALAGTLGNLFDSVLGASLERRHYLGNNGVNFLNTLFAAFVTLFFLLV